MKKVFITFFLFTIFLSGVTAHAGHFSLSNKSMLELKFTGRDYRELSSEDGLHHRQSFDNGKFSIGINHWTSENSAMTFSIAVSEVNTNYYFTEYDVAGTKSSLVPIFWGTRMYMTDRHGIMPIKPYFALAGGPVLGINNYIDDGDFVLFEDDVYLTFGGYVGGGVDVMFGRRTTVGLQAGYNFYGDFSEYIGDRKNFSGAEIGLSVGFLFGHDYNKPSNKKRKKRVVKF